MFGCFKKNLKRATIFLLLRISHFAQRVCIYWRSPTTISRRQLDQKIMRVCIFYTHLYSNKPLNHTLPLEKCKMYFWANMQVASTLWPDIKLQIKSERRFILKWTKWSPKTRPNWLRTGHASTLGQEEAQDNPPAEAGGGWRHWAIGRLARGPHRLQPTAWQPPIGSLH